MQVKAATHVLQATTWIVICSTAMIGLPVAAFAQQQSIPITNAGFESGLLGPGNYNFVIPGWTLSGFQGGTLAPTTGLGGMFPGGIPGGLNVAWLNTAVIIQDLGFAPLANTTYTLTVSVGQRADVQLIAYAVELLVGTTSVASDTTLRPAPGIFTLDKVIYNSGSSPGTGHLFIRLTGQGGQVNFDQVALNAVTTGNSNGPVPYYLSHLAVGGGFQTTLTYINYSPQAVTCTTNFYSNSGSPLSISFSAGTAVSTRTDTLQSGQSIHDQTTGNPAAVVEGWAQASCTGPVQASVLFRLYQAGVPVGEASVNAETAPTTEFVTFAQTATGVAYANPSTTQSATVTFTVYNAAGTRLANQIITLGPLAHGSTNLGPLLGIQNFTGFVKITSTLPIVSLSLNGEAFPVFSSLPPGDLPGSTTLVTP
jgi:hypothetical protein